MALLISGCNASWTRGVPADQGHALRWQQSVAADPRPRLPWAAARAIATRQSVAWVAATPGRRAAVGAWSQSTPIRALSASAPWVVSRRLDSHSRLLMAPGADRWTGVIVRAPWVISRGADSVTAFASNAISAALHRLHRCPWGDQIARDTDAWLPWGIGRQISQGPIIIIPVPDPDEPDPSTIIIPSRRTYIVINDASLKRVSNNVSLPVSSLSIAIDDGGAHWSWSASLPLAALDELEPDAPGELVELEAAVNGAAFRLLVESVRDREAFGSSSLAIGGRGIAAELSAPVYPVVSHDNAGAAANAQQLADAALMFNGVPLGWTLDWQAADWLVPAGAWVFGGTPLDAVSRIAAAAGAYVQAAPAARTLKVLPRYPVAPWDWHTATPAVILPAAAVLERGTEHAHRPAYNVVYVSGQAQGIRARVKRTGTAGDVAAEMVVDPLITHADAATGRGMEILGNTGAKRIVRLETGILPASGVIHVGALMDWVRGSVTQRGLVRGVSISASVPGGRSRQPLMVRQTVEVETNG